MVIRKVYPTIPPQVEYSLTDLGRSLAVPMMQLATWVLDHLAEIEAQQRAHDQQAERRSVDARVAAERRD